MEDCHDVSDQYYMLFNLLYEAIDKYIPRICLTNNKQTLTDLLSLKYVKSIDYENYIFRQTTSMFITNIVKLITKYLFLHDSPSNTLKKIFVMMLKIILKDFGNMPTIKEKPM